MISNIGVDIEEIQRFHSKNERLLAKILTKNEIKKNKRYNEQKIASIFSAKEAIIKACNPLKKFNFTDIEILHNKYGSPYVAVKGTSGIKARNLKISISHSKRYVIAVALLVKD